MNNFVSLAKQGYQAYESSQNQGNNNNNKNNSDDNNNNQQQQQQYGSNNDGSPSVTGGAQYNRPSNENSYEGGQGNSSYGGGEGKVEQPDLDNDAVIKSARKNADQDDDDDSNDSLFSSALSFAKNRFSNDSPAAQEPIDDERATQAHADAYKNNNASSMSTDSMGLAAAMQALKAFTGNSSSSGGTGGQSQMIGMAISEAIKLFSKSGGQTSDGGSKQDVANSAGAAVMKLLIQSKMSSFMGAGGSGGGGAGGSSSSSMLMGLAKQLM